MLYTQQWEGQFGKIWCQEWWRIFLGYSSQSKAYKVLNKRTNRVEESVHVVFNENSSEVEGNSEDEQNEETCSKPSEPKIWGEESTPSHKTPEIGDKSTNETGSSAPQEPVNIPTHSWKHQSSHPLQNILTPLNSSISTRSKLWSVCAFSAYVSLIEPKNIKEALLDSGWISVMQEELNQFERSRVWNLVPKPQNRTVIGTRWVFRNKLDEQG